MIMKCIEDCACRRHISRPKSAETRARMAAHPGNSTGHRHTEETKKKCGLTFLGRRHTPEAIAKMSAARRRWHQTCSPEVRARRSQKLALACAGNHAAGVYFKGPTSLELALRQLLTSAGFDFKEQEPFGRYVVDAWVPSHRLVFEADGMFWYHHQDEGREARRDAYLVAHGAAAVVHLTDEDLREVTGQWPQAFRPH